MFKFTCFVLSLSLLCGAVESRYLSVYESHPELVPFYRHLLEQTTNVSTCMNVSSQCGEDVMLYISALTRPQSSKTSAFWAYAMADADGKEMAGWMEGARHNPGSYEQCMRVKRTGNAVFDTKGNKTVKVGTHTFDAHYCRIQWPGTGWDAISKGVCVPGSCDRTDVNKLHNGGAFTNSIYVFCGTKPSILTDPGAIVTIFVLAFFAAIIAAATLYDSISPEGSTEKTSENVQERSKCKSRIEPIRHGADMAENVDASKAEAKLEEETREQLEIEEVTTGEKGRSVRDKAIPALLSFSLVRNVPDLFSTAHPPGTYTCMHGMRFLTLAWIMLGHCWQLQVFVLGDPVVITVENSIGTFVRHRRFVHMFINNMNNAVESFFLMSGCLGVISFMKQINRPGIADSPRKVLRAIGLSIAHRYLRVTPVYAAVLMIYANLFTYMGSGPLFPERFRDSANCQVNWWINLLYLNNIVRTKYDCMGWSWYMANDFQFSIVLPLFAFIMYKKPIAGCVTLALGFLGQMVAKITIEAYGGHWYLDIYVKPWCRFGSFAIGMALGYIMYRTQCKVRLNKWLVRVCWLVAMVLCVLSVYGNYRRRCKPGEDCIYTPQAMRIAYEATKREILALGLAWMIFACSSGYGGLVTRFLTLPLWAPLSRLTYGGYLVHPVILILTHLCQMRQIYVSDLTVIYLFLGLVLLTVGASAVLTLAFEVPILKAKKLFLPKQGL